ncbi:NUDIX hydrolase [Eubacteriales bacterium OttesenSCG-928-M02]|nr:NUDIX hydrolase [Eubacteriales bacterium OttesenSCG-928-M02]
MERKLAVAGLLFCGDRILLLKRQNPPLSWGPPGGRVEAGEDLAAAVTREVYEETGIGCRVWMPVEHWVGRNGVEELESISFLCSCETDAVTLSAEHDDFVWVPINELMDWEERTDFHTSRWGMYYRILGMLEAEER